MNQIIKFASHQFQGIAGRSNVQHRILQRRTSYEWEKMKKQTYDLEKRLLEFCLFNYFENFSKNISLSHPEQLK